MERLTCRRCRKDFDQLSGAWCWPCAVAIAQEIMQGTHWEYEIVDVSPSDPYAPSP